MRLASAMRSISNRSVRFFGDDQKISVSYLTSTRDSDGRVSGSSAVNVSILGYITEFDSNDVDGNSIQEFDKIAVLDAFDFDEKELSMDRLQYVYFDGDPWTVLGVVAGPYAIPSKYSVHIRKG